MDKVHTLKELKKQNKNVEVLFWIGCAGQLDERAIKITKAFCHILQKAKINFGILGREEACTGDPARRIGNEMLFQMLAQQNIQTLESYGIKKIVTTCPHCFNTLKNEYPDLGGTYEVVHHTQFIKSLIDKGVIKLKDTGNKESITYHDPCYLARANGVVEAPRDIIKALNFDIKEMNNCKKKGLCCGAGGGQMFKEEEKGSKRVNQRRLDEMLETKTNKVVVSCPFCNIMLGDANSSLQDGEKLTILDLAEVVNKNIM